MKTRRAKKPEQRNVLIRDFRLRNMAMPNRNLKSETRHPIPVVIDRSVAEFFYERDLVPRGYPLLKENMRLTDSDTNGRKYDGLVMS